MSNTMSQIWQQAFARGFVPAWFTGVNETEYLKPTVGPDATIQGTDITLNEWLRSNEADGKRFIGGQYFHEYPVQKALSLTGRQRGDIAYAMESTRGDGWYGFANVHGAYRVGPVWFLGYRMRGNVDYSGPFDMSMNITDVSERQWSPIRNQSIKKRASRAACPFSLIK